MKIPDSLKWLSDEAAGSQWLSRLPEIVADCERQWNLTIESLFEGGNVSYVLPATQSGRPVVLKIQYPHEEARYEAEALKRWNGDGAVRLLDHNQQHSAMLLERIVPATHLSSARLEDPIEKIIDLLPRLWVTGSKPFRSLTEEARGWQSRLFDQWERYGRPCEKKLIEHVHELIDGLAVEEGEQFLLHQDLHGENILLCDQRGWLAIDPKPLVGEREFSLSPILRSFEPGLKRSDVVCRLDRLCSELALDRERAKQWAQVQAVAWSFGGEFAELHYQTARWLQSA